MNEYSYLKRVEVRVQDLKVGMYVGKLDKPWEQSSFLFQGFPIESQEQIDQLKRECRKVYVDFKTKQQYEVFRLSTGTEVERDDSTIEKASKSLRRDTKFDGLSDELPSALAAFKNTGKELKQIHLLAAQDVAFSVGVLKKTVEQMLVSLNCKPEALLLLRNVKNPAEYTTEHQLRVSILALGFGMHLGMSEEQLKSLGLAGLLFDIGKARMPSLVINKRGKINRDEAHVLKHHPEESYRLLEKVDNLSEVVKEAALSHHERFDGKGYPRHIHKDRVSRYAKIISIIDAYDAITSERPYSRAKNASSAMSILTSNAGKKFDPFLVEQFITWLSPTPIGSLVEMKTGEVGLVIGSSVSQPDKPKLLIVTDRMKNTGTQHIIDLARESEIAQGEKYQIRELLVDGDFGVNLKRYLDKDAIGVSIWNQNANKNSPFDKFL
ncbi:MAG: HD-GYP domain-containing protein [Kangiellaceae bacterium]|nr:HD-GYP domain-containing protein [Kangiellaceae bacterium]